MVSQGSFSLASADVHSQRFEDEVVVLDTKSGLYFSLRGSAADVWSLIEGRASREAILTSLAVRYDGKPEAMVAAVDYCLTELSAKGLIRETPPNCGAPSLPTVCPTKQAFAEPVIEEFDDMQGLLLLDPIHDVSEEGWPHIGSDLTNG
jgi:hypothetical protein